MHPAQSNIIHLAALPTHLQQYLSHNAEEEQHRQHFINALSSGLSTDRAITTPGHIVVSALALNSATKKLALIFHDKLNRWLQPGGHVENGDDNLNAAAARELLEETGIAAEPQQLRLIDIDVHRIPDSTKQPTHLHFDLRFLYYVSTDNLFAGSDAQQGAWFSAEALPFTDEDSGLLRLASKLF